MIRSSARFNFQQDTTDLAGLGPAHVPDKRAHLRLGQVEVTEVKEIIGGIRMSDLVPPHGPDWIAGHLHRKLVGSEENARRDKCQCVWLTLISQVPGAGWRSKVSRNVLLQVLSRAEASSMSKTWMTAGGIKAKSCICRSRYGRTKVCEDEKCGDKLLFISTTRRVNVKWKLGRFGDMI